MGANSYILFFVTIFFTSVVMAELIDCPECKKRVSDKALACPGCGNPLRQKQVRLSPLQQKQVNNSQLSQDQFNDIRKSLVIVETDKSSGSAFVVRIGNKTYILTNAHVIDGAQSVTFQTIDGRKMPFTNVELAISNDLARVEIAGSNPNVIPICTEEPKLQQPITVYGNSQGKQVVTKVQGVVLGVGPNDIEVDADFVSGNSGSPVVNSLGQVIGVATYATFSPPGVNWPELGTRFTSVRRFAIRLDRQLEWERVDMSVLYTQTCLMSDITRIMRIWIDLLKEVQYLNGRGPLTFFTQDHIFCWRFRDNNTAQAMSSKEDEISTSYFNNDIYKLLDSFRSLYIEYFTIVANTRSTFRHGKERISTRSFEMTGKKAKLKVANAELITVPKKKLAETKWASWSLRQAAKLRLDILEEMKDKVLDLTEATDRAMNQKKN